MKKLSFAFMALTLLACSSDDTAGDNPAPVALCDNYFEGSVVLRSQEDVDDFAAQNYCGITGDLTIGDQDIIDDISDLSGLSELREVKGFFYVKKAEILSGLHGLENLERVTNLILQETALETLEHLQSLKEVNWVVIQNNSKLHNLKGLDKVQNISSLEITGNETFASLEGLGALQVINTLEIGSNPALVSLDGLIHIRNITTLKLYANPNLTSLQSLENIEVLNNLRFDDNAGLTSFPLFRNLRKIDSFRLYGSNFSDLQAFKYVTEITAMYLVDMPNLTSLNGLENLKKSTDIVIERCTSLTSLTTLSNLRELRYLKINATGIASLSGLEKLNDGSFEFRNNPSLTDYCAIRNVLGMGTAYTAVNNAYNPSREEIIAGLCSQ